MPSESAPGPSPALTGATTLSELLRRPVLDAAGRRVGRLHDLGVTPGDDGPLVTSIRVHRKRQERTLPWAAVGELGPHAVRLARSGTSVVVAPGELLLARDVLDRQIFDLRGKRVTRVGDVALALDRASLRVIGVETGPAAILRRLGLRRLARRIRPSLTDWSELHFLSGRGHALQLAAPTAAVHRLDAHELAELVRKAPHARAAGILAAVPDEQATQARGLLARMRPRRRSSDPLSVRKRAPS